MNLDLSLIIPCYNEEGAIAAAVDKAKQALESLDGIEWYLDLGVKHFRIGTDIGILRSFWSENGEKLRDIVSSL